MNQSPQPPNPRSPYEASRRDRFEAGRDRDFDEIESWLRSPQGSMVMFLVVLAIVGWIIFSMVAG